MLFATLACIRILSACPQIITDRGRLVTSTSAASGIVSQTTPAFPLYTWCPQLGGAMSSYLRFSTPIVMAASSPMGDGAEIISRMNPNCSAGIGSNTSDRRCGGGQTSSVPASVPIVRRQQPMPRRVWTATVRTPYRVTLSRLAPGFSVHTWEIQQEKSHQNRESDSPYP
eukprot:SAG31_NODE_3764_length_3904_cov_1.346386_1_plen_169_part_10